MATVVSRAASVKRSVVKIAVLLACAAVAAPAHAAEDVVIGAIYPPGAARQAIETALEIINGQHDPLDVLMGKGGGLDRLGGAHLRVVFADDSGNPAQAAAEAERLISAEHVIALIGGAEDATADSISAVADRHTIPHLSFDAAATRLSQRDLTWFFRIGPSRSMTAEALLRFLAERQVHTLALVSDDSPAARDTMAAARKAAEAASMAIVADLKVAPAATLAAEALVIAGAKPDAVVTSLAVGDAMMLVRRLAEQQVKTLLAGSGAGMTAPEFLIGLGTAAQGSFITDGFAADAVKARPMIPQVNAAFKARSGRDLDAATARELTGTLLLADVIDRAGSTKPIDLRTALMATNAAGAQTVMAWQGVRFDTTGQNVLATPAVQQVQGGAWATVYPEALAMAPVLTTGK